MQTIIIIAMESLTNCMFAYSTLQVSIAKLLQWNQVRRSQPIVIACNAYFNPEGKNS
jgi:hypothetical protein